MAYLSDHIAAWLAKLPIARFQKAPPLVAVVPLQGVIGSVVPFGGGGMSLPKLANRLRSAFALPRLAAVALAINSPGGSAGQSELIAGRIRALADEKKVPVFAFIEDLGASGGYWLACAADEIFAVANGVVGSIGVIHQGFGFVELMQRLGISRRLYTAGTRKGMLDPFSPEKQEDVASLTAIQGDIHANFKDWVRARRGSRLKGAEETLFSGEFWAARRAVDLGLIDGIGDLRGTLRARYGEKVRLRLIGERPSGLRRMLRFGARVAPEPAQWAEALLAAAETRALWARYGL
jgi:signal peptide peptidase SppA